MFRLAVLGLILAVSAGPAQGQAQQSSAGSGGSETAAQVPAAEPPVQESLPGAAAQKSAPAAVAPAPEPSQQVLDAEAAIVKNDWKGAEAKLTPWLASHGSDARALFDAGYVAEAENHDEEAAGLYTRAVAADPKRMEAHLSLGLLLARTGKFDEARTELAAATTLDPGEGGAELKGKAWRALARVDERLDATAASEDLLAALKITPETLEDTLLAANLADEAGQYVDAEKQYRRVLAEDAKSHGADTGLAHVLIATRRYEDAETLLRGALKDYPEDPALTAQLAAVLAAEDKAEALPLLEKLHTAQPESAPITRMLAEVRSEAGDAAGSDTLYVELLKASPDDVELLMAHGENLSHLKLFTQAFATFEKATKLDATSAEGWSGLAYAASRTNQPNVTLHALAERSKYLAEVPGTYFLWATAYDTLHDKTEAASYYHHFLEASAGKFPDQEWQARQRLKVLEEEK